MLNNHNSLISSANQETIYSEHEMKTWDGSTLFYRAWHPGHVHNKAIVLFHGGHEHSGRFQDLVDKLALNEASVFAWDARGHGRSPGARGFADHFTDLVRDADCFVRHISNTYQIPLENMIALGHSVGSVIISTWLLDYSPSVCAAVLGSPAFKVKLYAPLALPALKLWQKLKPNAVVNSYVKPSMLTHDQEEAEARRNDPLISPEISVSVLTSLFDVSKRVIDNANAITTPILLLSAGNDWVVKHSAQQAFFDNLGSSKKHMRVFDGFYHEIFHELKRDEPIKVAKQFIDEQFQQEPACIQNKIVEKDQASQRSLTQPLPWHSPKKAYYDVTGLFLKSIGRLSKGIRLGWESGFDSGRTLDYVYRNQALGFTPLGRLIDRHYLNAGGWRGIRKRGENLQQVLNQTIRRLLMSGEKVHLMDIAAGPGRYVLNTLVAFNFGDVSATCRDWDDKGLQEGRQLANELGIENICYEKADAFSLDSYSQLQTAPNIVVASGLYELFSDNEMVQRSLHGIYNAMPAKGYLIYTNQPHHPQLELIARTLINRDQQPWVMRLRSQNEMHQLARRAGFTPVSTLIDAQGIFSVNLAVKRG